MISTGIFRAFAVRTASSIVCLLLWFFASNHCAFATLGNAGTAKSKVVGTCSHCAAAKGDGKSSPAGVNGCCKELRVTSAFGKPFQLGLVQVPSLSLLPALDALLLSLAARTISVAVDTGPPGTHSFAELVLQRSLLAHAPPSVI